MSTSSGFASKQLETSYNKALFALLFLCQSALVDVLEHESHDNEKFVSNLKKIVTRMNFLETQKQSPPNFSKAIRKLLKFVGLREDFI